MRFFKTFLAVCKKDLSSEFRKRERLNTLLFFGVIVIFLFSFAFGTDPALLRNLSPGLLWLVGLLSSLLALERSFQGEAEEGTLDRLILYAENLKAVFLAKLFVNFLFIFSVQLIVLVFMAILFDLEAPKNFPVLFATLFLGNWGIASLGTFYAALITNMRGRQAMLPLLLFPMLIPLLLSATLSTEYALHGLLAGDANVWLWVMAVYDLIFFSAGLLICGEILD